MTRGPALGLLLLLGACASERVRDLPVIDAGDVVLVVDEGGPWEEVPAEAGPPAPAPAAEAPVAAAVPPPRADALPVLPRRTAPPAKGAPPRKSLEALARERHLDHPTRIRAGKITFRCPPGYVAEVRTSGARTRQETPERRVVEGGASLLCRELTLEAETIVLQVRDDGLPDVQVMARGDVSFVSDQRGQVFREEGLRSLLLTNDRVVPLR